MSESQKYPILASLTKKYPGIKFDADKCEFQCTCGEGLALDKILIEKLAESKADPMIAHICKTSVHPWLEEHRDCCGSALAE